MPMKKSFQFKTLLEPRKVASLGLLGAFLLSAPFVNASLFGNDSDPGTFPGTVLPVVGGNGSLSNPNPPANGNGGTGSVITSNSSSFFNQPTLTSTGVIYNGSIPPCGIFCEITHNNPAPAPVPGGSYFANGGSPAPVPVTTGGAVSGGGSYFGNGTNSAGAGTGVLIPINTNANGGTPATPIQGSAGVGFFGNIPTQPYNVIDLFNPHPGTVATPVAGSSGVGLFGNTPTEPYNVIDLFNVRPAGGANGGSLFPITTGPNGGVITPSNGVDLLNVRPAGGANGNTLFPVTGSDANIPSGTVPLLQASCAPSTSQASIGQIITWNAGIIGGTGAYAVSWSGTDGLAGSGLHLSGGYTTRGTKSAVVTVTSGSQTASAACSLNVL